MNEVVKMESGTTPQPGVDGPTVPVSQTERRESDLLAIATSMPREKLVNKQGPTPLGSNMKQTQIHSCLKKRTSHIKKSVTFKIERRHTISFAKGNRTLWEQKNTFSPYSTPNIKKVCAGCYHPMPNNEANGFAAIKSHALTKCTKANNIVLQQQHQQKQQKCRMQEKWHVERLNGIPGNTSQAINPSDTEKDKPQNPQNSVSDVTLASITTVGEENLQKVSKTLKIQSELSTTENTRCARQENTQNDKVLPTERLKLVSQKNPQVNSQANQETLAPNLTVKDNEQMTQVPSVRLKKLKRKGDVKEASTLTTAKRMRYPSVKFLEYIANSRMKNTNKNTRKLTTTKTSNSNKLDTTLKEVSESMKQINPLPRCEVVLQRLSPSVINSFTSRGSTKSEEGWHGWDVDILPLPNCDIYTITDGVTKSRVLIMKTMSGNC